jgi:hypothetical protein
MILHGARHVGAWCKACWCVVQGMLVRGARHVGALECGSSLSNMGPQEAVLGMGGVMRLNG